MQEKTTKSESKCDCATFNQFGRLNGKHIHGFFVVWTDKKHYHTNGKARRYLVDMFSHQHFPLFVKYKSWETRLKMAFNRVTAYNPNLAEIIRANRLRIHLF